MADVLKKDAKPDFEITVDVLLSPGPKIRPGELPYPFLLRVSVPESSGMQDTTAHIRCIMIDSQGRCAEALANSYTRGSEVCWYADIDLNMTSLRGTCEMEFKIEFWDDSCPVSKLCDAESFFVSVKAGNLIVDENAPPPSLSKYYIPPSCYTHIYTI
jgi:hypothetical protein